ncbi:hypothetical protein SSP531S_41330 [Streptomyces spongiicola]|uniref:Uncharacterized protein n=1 Tax=Streptomyces spongiicola TaxID=1690221 RepID=A0A388T154_9ACTN|nr:hypothetical protein SSP531S_41330 [Streptomyces spongiicola]
MDSLRAAPEQPSSGCRAAAEGLRAVSGARGDGTFTVVAAKRDVAMLLEGPPERLLTPPLNAMRTTLHPEGLAPRIRDLRDWCGHPQRRPGRNARSPRFARGR